MTPLHYAAEYGQNEVMRFLTEQQPDADIDANDNVRGETQYIGTDLLSDINC